MSLFLENRSLLELQVSFRPQLPSSPTSEAVFQRLFVSCENGFVGHKNGLKLVKKGQEGNSSFSEGGWNQKKRSFFFFPPWKSCNYLHGPFKQFFSWIARRLMKEREMLSPGLYATNVNFCERVFVCTEFDCWWNDALNQNILQITVHSVQVQSLCWALTDCRD